MDVKMDVEQIVQVAVLKVAPEGVKVEQWEQILLERFKELLILI
jgi:hypothetical protein